MSTWRMARVQGMRGAVILPRSRPILCKMPHRVFLLSPARCDGKRAQVVLRDAASFPLARRLRTEAGAPLGEVFSFLSGLYFRGKLAYARRFGAAPRGL